MSTVSVACIAFLSATSPLSYVFYPPFYPQAVDDSVDTWGERVIVSAKEKPEYDNIRATTHLSTDFVDYLWVNRHLIHKIVDDCGRIYIRLVENCLASC